MPDGGSTTRKVQIPPNLRLIRLVEIVAEAGAPVSRADLTKALALPKATVHRLLSTAEQAGLLQRHIDGRSYGPGRRLHRLATQTLASERVREERVSLLSGLAEAVGETCNIAVPGRTAMIYLERVETHWPLRIQLPIGTQVPFNCTASGKMYLSSLRADRLDRLLANLPLQRNTDRSIVDRKRLVADLKDTRRRGYSRDDEEFMDGMAAIAVPITDENGRLLSTLSIHAPVQRNDVSGLVRHLDHMRKTASGLELLARDWAGALSMEDPATLEQS